MKETYEMTPEGHFVTTLETENPEDEAALHALALQVAHEGIPDGVAIEMSASRARILDRRTPQEGQP